MEPCCQQWLEQMSAALDGELSPPERRELDTHLAACPPCARCFDTLSRHAQALRTLEAAAPEGLADSILSRLPPQAPAPRPRRRWLGPAVCAALVLAVGLPAALSRLSGPATGGSAAPEAAMAQSLHDTADPAEGARPRTTAEDGSPAEADSGSGMFLTGDTFSTADGTPVDAVLSLSAPPPEELAPWDSLPGGQQAGGGQYRLVDAALLARVLDWAKDTPGLSFSLSREPVEEDGIYAIFW